MTASESFHHIEDVLLPRYVESGDISVLDEAFEAWRAAAESAREPDGDPDGDPSLADRLRCMLLRERYWITDDPDLLQAAVDRGRAAANKAVGDEERVRALSELGYTLRILDADPDAAVAVLRSAVENAPSDFPDRAQLLDRLAAALVSRSRAADSADDAHEAVGLAREALAMSANGRHAILAHYQLGYVLGRLHELDPDPATAAESVAEFRTAAASLPTTHTHYALYNDRLSNALYHLYMMTEDADALREATAAARAAVAGSITPHDRRHYLRQLATQIGFMAVRLGEPEAFREAATLRREDFEATAEDDPERWKRLEGVGDILAAAWEITDDVTWLDESIEVFRELVARTPPESDAHTEGVKNLRGVMYSSARHHYDKAWERWRTYEESGMLDHLREAVAAGRLALEATPIDDPDYASRADNLADDLFTLSFEVREPELVLEAIAVRRGVLDNAADDDPETDTRRQKLAMYLLMHGDRSGDPTSLLAADELFESWLADLPPDGPTRASLLGFRTAATARLFERDGDPDTLARGIALGREAVAALSDPDDIAIVHDSLGSLLYRRFETAGDPGDLEEAIALGRVLVDDGTDPQRLSIGSVNIVNSLVALFERTADPGRLEEAIELGRRAVAATPADAQHRGFVLNALGHATLTRALHLGDIDAQAESLQYLQEAATALGPENQSFSVVAGGLSSLHRLRYVASGDVADLNDMVRYARQAVAASPAGHFGHAIHLMTLAGSLTSLAGRTGSGQAAAEALEAAREAVADTPAQHFLRPVAMNVLASVLYGWYQRTNDLTVAREAMAIHDAVLASLPEDNVRYVGSIETAARTLELVYSNTRSKDVLERLIAIVRRGLASGSLNSEVTGRLNYLLASASLFRFEDYGDTAALAEAGVHYRASALVSASVPRQLVGWQASSHVLVLSGLGREALAAMEKAVALMPMVAPRELTSRDREVRLTETRSTAASAVVAALAAGDPVRGVELFEQARGVLLGEAMAQRATPSTLYVDAPALAEEFERACDDLAELAADPGNPAVEDPVAGLGDRAEQQRSTQRRDASARWRAAVERIRELPEYSDFLLPVPVGRLQAQVQRAPVVLLTAHPDRCTALVLTDDTADPVRVVTFPDLDPSAVAGQANRFTAATRTTQSGQEAADVQRRAQRTASAILEWLWDAVAEPVLSALDVGTAPRPGEPWRRLWWCPSGAFVSLPLHAAGYHGDVAAGDVAAGAAAPRTVLDRIVSSYAVTVRGLAYAARNPARSAADGGALIVSVPEADGAVPLHGIRDEVADLMALMPHATLLDGPRATRDAVRDALPAHAIAHFACHGISDLTTPRDSRLLLADHRHHPLSVEAVSRLELKADLAFLSACETTNTPAQLTEEALHITSAFQLAGYRHVIGTQWQVNDTAARQVAAEFYRRLTAGGTRSPDPELSPFALHDAVRLVRSSGQAVATPTRWAAHVHVGP
ncbi:CHAT domain-containing protein [Catenulispora yoronensis]|uniref:CHAT domain-containing protein n=1 Tax=Catenulispora yoronensis TaxID=450799 RepID=A0ABN2V0G0_9ACTN